ncbi:MULTISPECIES: GNAT family N-acetyltransferase [Clostridium]|uniref:GNAT family N-acetyltransferase n=1 Tax=Clostridium sporogenes TaxID=1509 RepID=A0A7X5SYZ1_CLOSG|nr:MULTISPECIES: GNAT family N-acetyltransferase [Clostridium]AJD32839.1 acetyltransferase domain protein [Clostridium botulinum Prevot_594]KRU41443.1 GNAT family acetyltransferase [Clostridium sporogenes]MBE6057216.1 GNAT family N-acetyltransferase [Clostridium sp.]MBY7013985.1 GNAT family N-acetyltransferase [Clostridium sporogenes]MBY7063147.1 GNAT family N-acetyltransferase [Clostridium sporogenes]
MNNYFIRESNSEQEADLIVDRIVEYNLSKVPGKQEVPLLCINRVIEGTNGEIIAGILSNMYCWNCIYIDVLWVKEEYRKDGLGTKLLKELEKIAKEKDCHLIHLDTFDFQAKDFYIRHGYEIFGVLDQCPENHKRYFMKKNI